MFSNHTTPKPRTNSAWASLKAAVMLLGLISMTFSANAQSSKLSDYLILAGDNSCNTTANCGVNVGPNNTYSGGIIGSYNGITSQGGMVYTGGLYAEGLIILGGGNQVAGNIFGSNSSNATGNIMSAGSGSGFGGNITVNGNILLSGGTVAGQVSHPAGTSYSGPVPAGGEVQASYNYNALPSFPPIEVFAAAGNGKINNSPTITPGAYGAMTLKGNRTITFDGPGDYVFSRIKNGGSSNTFVFDFKNQPSGAIRILVHGDVDLGKMKIDLPNGGDASRIYTEVHGDGSSNGNVAWYISGGSTGGGNSSEWYGTVWAPFGGIEIGGGSDKSVMKGAMFSTSFVNLNNNLNLEHVPFQLCNNSISIQISIPDTITCKNPIETLVATTGASNPQYSWTTNEGLISSGANTASPQVIKQGYYTLTVTDGFGCTGEDSVFVVFQSCILPYYPAPEGGKTFNLIGSELFQYNAFPSYQDSLEYIFVTQSDSVYIEIIVRVGEFQNALNIVTGPNYGMTNLIDNGPADLVITGLFPRSNLQKLDSLSQYIVYVRPLFEGILKGAATSQGDELLRAPFVRGGYDIAGEGVKIGVLSNSFNTQPGNQAQKDVQEEDLPGAGHSLNTNPVNVLKEYPFGTASDEGRAMLQIVHDIAPKADLAFRTGFISAGDFAQGILDLAADSCDIIVDDITYITEPFLSDGIIAQTVNAVKAQGVTYISSAGNFGDNAYGSDFNPAPAPAGIIGMAHDFGGGDIYQSVSLAPGNYVMVLQWQDSVYSIGQTSTGTNNDLDMYLTDGLGNTLFGFNRPNVGGDPLEVMPFTVTDSAQSNILVVRAAGSDNVPFKLIVFRGNLTFNEYNTGKSTIVGHPNAEGAISVAAVNYFETPDYGVDPALVAPFSSLGGTSVGGIIRNKPDFAAPNGVNTTVDLGGPDWEADGLPNFFGTSASAPHVAAVAALVKSAQAKFEGYNTSPDSIRSILASTAIDLGTPGFDFESGAGMISADRALASFANPTPFAAQMTLVDTTKTPGVDTVTIRIEGAYFTSNTKVVFRDTDTLSSVFINSTTIEAEVLPHTGNPAIRAYEKPITSSLLDGGFADTLLFSDPIKKRVQVFVDDQVKYYGAAMPIFSYEILVDSAEYSAAGYSLSDLGLDSLDVFTLANNLSNVGVYRIRLERRAVDISDPFDYGLTESFTWELNEGQLQIEKMPLTITVKDTTLEYGQMISDFEFTYDYADSLVNPLDSVAVYDSIFVNHVSNIANAVILVNGEARGEYLASSRVLVNADVEKQTYMASSRVLVNARPYTNPGALFNSLPDTTFVIDISAESIFDYVDGPDTVTMSNAYEADGASKEYVASSRVLVNALDLAAGRVLVNAVSEDGTKYEASSRVLVNAVPIINAKVDGDGDYVASGRVLVNDYPVVNGQPVNQDSSEIVLLLDETDADTTLTDTIFPFFPINMILGNDVGSNPVVPAALYNPNFNISYQLGTITYTPATITVTAGTLSTTYGDSVLYNYTTEGYQYVDSAGNVIDGPPTYNLLDNVGNPVAGNNVNAGSYTVVPNSLDLADPSNYQVSYVNGYLQVGAAELDVSADDTTLAVYGNAYTIGVSYDGFKYDDSEINAVVSGPDKNLSIGGTPYTNTEVAAGAYDVGLSNLVLTSPSNYNVNYIDGGLWIAKAGLTIIARDTSKTYGDANPVFKIDYSAFQYLDNVGDITAPSASSSADATSPVGNYPITLTGGSAANYQLNYTDGNLYVDFASLIATADSANKTYGDANPVFTISYSGFLNADNATSITEPTATSLADAASAVGNYAIALSGGTAINYSLTLNNGSLTVDRASLVATADDDTRTYGDANPVFTLSYSGFLNGDAPEDITAPAASSAASATSSVGNYPITLSGGSAANYSLSLNDGNLYVDFAALIATANDTSKIYGDINPVFTLDYSGFLNGDGVTDISEPTASATADGTSPVGNYNILLTGGSSVNYNLQLNDGNLNIQQASIVVTADDALIFAGDPTPLYSYTLSGAVNPADIINGSTSYTLSPAYTGSAGVYQIIPSGLGITNSSSYIITYQTGSLYVNPVGNQVKNVKPSLVCVDGPLNNHPSGFAYVAFYAWENTNANAIFIPTGPDNQIISAGAHSGILPEFFPPGSDTIEIYFDGIKMNWQITTDNSIQKTSSTSESSSTSNKCGAKGNGNGNGNGKGKNKTSLTPSENPELQVFPNPTTGLVNIIPEDNLSDPYQVHVFDVSGRQISDQVQVETETGWIRIDLSGVASGMYLIQLTNSEKTHYIRMAKDE